MKNELSSDTNPERNLRELVDDFAGMTQNLSKYEYFITGSIIGVLVYYLKNWLFDTSNILVSCLELSAAAFLVAAAGLSILCVRRVLTSSSIVIFALNETDNQKYRSLLEEANVDFNKLKLYRRFRDVFLMCGIVLILLAKAWPLLQMALSLAVCER